MNVGDCVGDSFDFEVTALHVDRSLRSSYSNNIMNNTTGVNAISRILTVCGYQPGIQRLWPHASRHGFHAIVLVAPPTEQF